MAGAALVAGGCQGVLGVDPGSYQSAGEGICRKIEELCRRDFPAIFDALPKLSPLATCAAAFQEEVDINKGVRLQALVTNDCLGRATCQELLGCVFASKFFDISTTCIGHEAQRTQAQACVETCTEGIGGKCGSYTCCAPWNCCPGNVCKGGHCGAP